MTLFWLRGGDRRVARIDRVHEFDETVGQRGAIELKQVFRVVLAGMRQVVTAGKDGVVDHGDLGVHEIVDTGRRVRGGDFGSEGERGADRLEGRPLPGRVRIDSPLAEYPGHLGAVVDAFEVWMR